MDLKLIRDQHLAIRLTFENSDRVKRWLRTLPAKPISPGNGSSLSPDFAKAHLMDRCCHPDCAFQVRLISVHNHIHHKGMSLEQLYPVSWTASGSSTSTGTTFLTAKSHQTASDGGETEPEEPNELEKSKEPQELEEREESVEPEKLEEIKEPDELDELKEPVDSEGQERQAEPEEREEHKKLEEYEVPGVYSGLGKHDKPEVHNIPEEDDKSEEHKKLEEHDVPEIHSGLGKHDKPEVHNIPEEDDESEEHKKLEEHDVPEVLNELGKHDEPEELPQRKQPDERPRETEEMDYLATRVKERMEKPRKKPRKKPEPLHTPFEINLYQASWFHKLDLSEEDSLLGKDDLDFLASKPFEESTRRQLRRGLQRMFKTPSLSIRRRLRRWKQAIAKRLGER
ncbi:hypothetical protein H112_01923 [Trichophyton rubrum D6]|uniref:Uncharacterized protein n=4 Tax=Trichophyton TaxID=5550 RepID=A0A178EZB8_TRIRU|nr:uncharacterized protein TERG_06691 [Trichophyton rubrum CBS 118892]EZF25916.1 hypothetical protein H100_01919 [Trichophyton rubrum MR850]EZF44892.1 hypothetical protein H102_01917 [Trichophyton rubrum CBS 100081]EZF55545.1 hypothetical protein H103_01928 [Trichophyton rubrum CBS 288.86]EZF66125.1 hypothetical protein H104_01903 [Trichophyton rubrum CBS 289.86]EZF76746.1 hypothetical protein H105_01933 [Trichophyton soudanense CBS 452.61]EZF87402.1 hypothetical protein H110_01926 [Trichophy